MMAKGEDGRGGETARAMARGPFSRSLRIHDVPERSGVDRHVEATAAECIAIADDTGLAAVAMLQADFHVARRASGRFDVTGTLRAVVTEVCVVSLEPFETALAQDIAISFALPPAQKRESPNPHDHPHAMRDPRGGERLRVATAIDLDLQDESPDPIVDNMIDLGAVALEFLTLARDFYPKKPGVEFGDGLIDENDQQDPSPFAALERFKDQS